MDDDIKKSIDWLENLAPKGKGFKVPDAYFDQLESQVFGKIDTAGMQANQAVFTRKKAKRFSLIQVFLAAAAVFALVLAAVWFFQPAVTNQQTIAAVELSEAEIEAYLLENIQDFDSKQLAMLTTGIDLDIQPDMEEVPATKPDIKDPYEILPEDLDLILNDLTEEELEEIF